MYNKYPPRVHSLFNPIIFEIMLEQEALLQQTFVLHVKKIGLANSAPTTPLEVFVKFTKKNNVPYLRFDARNFIGKLFGEMEEITAETVCDEYQSIHYSIELVRQNVPNSGIDLGTYTVVRSVAQVGESQHLVNQQFKLLTGFKQLKVYDGYPFDASIFCPPKGEFIYQHPEKGAILCTLVGNKVNKVRVDCMQTEIELVPQFACEGEWSEFICQETTNRFQFAWTHFGGFPNNQITQYHPAVALQGKKRFDLVSLKNKITQGYQLDTESCPDWIHMVELGPEHVELAWDTNYGKQRTATLNFIQAESGHQIQLIVTQDRALYRFEWQVQEINSDQNDTIKRLHLSVNYSQHTFVKHLHSVKGEMFLGYSIVSYPGWVEETRQLGEAISFTVSNLPLGASSRHGEIVLQQDETNDRIVIQINQATAAPKCFGSFGYFICQVEKGTDYIPVYTLSDFKQISSNKKPYVLMNDLDFDGEVFPELDFDGVQLHGQGFAIKNIRVSGEGDLSLTNSLMKDIRWENIEIRDMAYFIYASHSEIVNCQFVNVTSIRKYPSWIFCLNTQVLLRYNSFIGISIQTTHIPEDAFSGIGEMGVIGLVGAGNVIEDCYADTTLGQVHWHTQYRGGLVCGNKNDRSTNFCRRVVLKTDIQSISPINFTENTASGAIASLCEAQDCVVLGGAMVVGEHADYSLSAGRVHGNTPGNNPYIHSYNNYVSEAFRFTGRQIVSNRNGVDGETISVAQAQTQLFYEGIGYNFDQVWAMGEDMYPKMNVPVRTFKPATNTGNAFAQDYRYTQYLGGNLLLQENSWSLLDAFVDSLDNSWPQLSETEYSELSVDEVNQRATALVESLGKCDDFTLENTVVKENSTDCIDFVFEWHEKEIRPELGDDSEILHLSLGFEGGNFVKEVVSLRDSVPHGYTPTKLPDWVTSAEINGNLFQFTLATLPENMESRTGVIELTQKDSLFTIYVELLQEGKASCAIQFFDFVCRDLSNACEVEFSEYVCQKEGNVCEVEFSEYVCQKENEDPITQHCTWVNPVCQQVPYSDTFDQFKFRNADGNLYHTATLYPGTDKQYTLRNFVSYVGKSSFAVELLNAPQWLNCKVRIENEAYCVDMDFDNPPATGSYLLILQQIDTKRTLDLRIVWNAPATITPAVIDFTDPMWNNSGKQFYQDLEFSTRQGGAVIASSRNSFVDYLGVSVAQFIVMDVDQLKSQAALFLAQYGKPLLPPANTCVAINTEACPIIQVDRVLHVQPLASPRSVVAEKDGYLYLSDMYNGLIKINPSLVDGSLRTDFFNKNRKDDERVLQSSLIGNRNGHLLMVPFNRDGIVFDLDSETVLRDDIDVPKKAVNLDDDNSRTNRCHTIYLPSVDEFLLVSNRGDLGGQGYRVIDPKKNYLVSDCYKQYGIPSFSQETADGHVFLVTSFVANYNEDTVYNTTGFLRKISSKTKATVLEVPLPKIPVFKVYDSGISGPWYRKDFRIAGVIGNNVFISATDCMLVYDTETGLFEVLNFDRVPGQYLLSPSKMGYNPYRDCYYIVGSAKYWDGNAAYQLSARPYLWVYSQYSKQIVRTISDFDDIAGGFNDIYYSPHWKNVYLVYDKSAKSSNQQPADADHASDGGILVYN